MDQKYDTYMNILIYNSDQQHITMSEIKTEYIICLCLINNIQSIFASSSYLGFLTLTKFWFHLLVNSSTSSFKKLNSLTFQISISQYSICTCSILLSSLLTFYHFIFKLSIFYLLSANIASILSSSLPEFFFSLLPK